MFITWKAFKKLPFLRYYSKHPYKHIKYSSQELADELTRNVIYNKNGLIVLNKPYGITFSEGAQAHDSFGVSINTLRPYFTKHFNCSEFFSARVPERYASGVSIFCTNEDLLKKVRKCIRSMRGRNLGCETNDCIVLGHPTFEYGKFVGGITLQESPDKKKKGIKLVEGATKSSVRKGSVKAVSIRHHTCDVSELATRLQITTSRTKWHAVRVYASTSLVAPLLGDRVFGGLVRTVLGSPVPIHMFSPAASQPQKLPKELLSKLDLVSRQDVEIPLHMHVCKIRLENFPSKGEHLEFTAEPPEFFKWTCERLNLLKYETNKLVNREKSEPISLEEKEIIVI